MKRSIWTVVAIALLAVACGKAGDTGESGAKAPDPAARKAALTTLESAKKALDAKREELASLKDQLANGAAVQSQIDAAKAEVDKMADALGTNLVAYINAGAPEVGAPMPADEQEAIRMKSAEDMIIAKEFIDQSGDYRKAIDIYNASLQIDPNNADLKAALADAQVRRYMTSDRFAQIQKGMTEQQVVNLIGRPYYRNVRDYPEKKVTAWFYPKNEDGEAAGVFFNSEKKNVYSTNFNAVKRSSEPQAEAPH